MAFAMLEKLYPLLSSFRALLPRMATRTSPTIFFTRIARNFGFVLHNLRKALMIRGLVFGLPPTFLRFLEMRTVFVRGFDRREWGSALSKSFGARTTWISK